MPNKKCWGVWRFAKRGKTPFSRIKLSPHCVEATDGYIAVRVSAMPSDKESAVVDAKVGQRVEALLSKGDRLCSDSTVQVGRDGNGRQLHGRVTVTGRVDNKVVEFGDGGSLFPLVSSVMDGGLRAMRDAGGGMRDGMGEMRMAFNAGELARLADYVAKYGEMRDRTVIRFSANYSEYGGEDIGTIHAFAMLGGSNPHQQLTAVIGSQVPLGKNEVWAALAERGLRDGSKT